MFPKAAGGMSEVVHHFEAPWTFQPMLAAYCEMEVFPSVVEPFRAVAYCCLSTVEERYEKEAFPWVFEVIRAHCSLVEQRKNEESRHFDPKAFPSAYDPYRLAEAERRNEVDRRYEPVAFPWVVLVHCWIA
jgi:hypothetical protein